MFFLAIRQLLARKRQTIMILLGIFFGTMIYILIAGIQLGFRHYIAEQLLNSTAHIRIAGSENTINPKDITPRFFDDSNVRWVVEPQGKRWESYLENYQGWYERLEKDPNVLTFAPRFSLNGIIRRGKLKETIALEGIIPSKQLRVTSIEDYMKEGSLSDLEGGGNKIILGSGVMESIGAKIMDTVKVTAGTGESGKPFKIIGVVDFGNEQLDDKIAYANLRDVQQLNRTPGRISEIAVALVDINLSKEMADRWNLLSNDKVENWEEANKSFMQMIRIQDIVRFIITFSILIVAAFGIYNVLSIMISQKQREIAILRAIGYPPKRILKLFLIQGTLLGFVGAVLGMIVGYFASQYIGSIDLGFRIGKGTSLIISYAVHIYITAFIAAQIAAIIASFLPAFAASRLSPMEIIRTE